MSEKIKPIDCSCGGKAIGRYSTLKCSLCTRVVMTSSRNESVKKWNKAIELYIKDNCE